MSMNIDSVGRDSISGKPSGSGSGSSSDSLLNGYSQNVLDKVGQYLSKHKMVLLEKSHFTLQQVFDLLENQSTFKNIDSIIANLDQNMLNSSSSSQSSSLDFNVQTNAETHIEHSSDIGHGLSRVGDNPEVNISPTVYTPHTSAESFIVSESQSSVMSTGTGVPTIDTATHAAHAQDIDRGIPGVDVNPDDNATLDSSPVPDSSQSFHAEMYLLLNYIAELEMMAKAKIKVCHLQTVKNFALRVQKCHMDFVFEHFAIQKILDKKNDEIISLQNRVIDIAESSSASVSKLESLLGQSQKIDCLQNSVSQIVPKIDAFIDHCHSSDAKSIQNNEVSHNCAISDENLHTIDSKIDKLVDSIDQLPPKIASISSSKTLPVDTTPVNSRPTESQDDPSEGQSSNFDPSTHDWDNGEYVTVVKKQRSNNRGCPKPLTYSDVLSKPAKELDMPKISKGGSERKTQKTCILLLEPPQKTDKMSNSYFLGIKSKIKVLVNKENKKILIDSINPTKSGGVLLSFPTQKDLDLTKQILSNAVNELKLTPMLPRKILPKIEISNIDGAIPQSQIVKVLLEKNPEIRSKIESENSIF